MKKLLITTTLIGSLISSIAAAQNENQFSISAINSKVENTYHHATTDRDLTYDNEGSAISFAVNYGYKIKLPSNLSLTPGIFYDNINNLGKESLVLDKEKIKYRYGAKVDLGYEIFDNLSLFTSLGVANVKYSVSWDTNTRFYKSDDDISLVYGVGATYDVNDDIFISTEYNMQSIEINANAANNIQHYDSDIRVFKLGVGYKF